MKISDGILKYIPNLIWGNPVLRTILLSQCENVGKFEVSVSGWKEKKVSWNSENLVLEDASRNQTTAEEITSVSSF